MSAWDAVIELFDSLGVELWHIHAPENYAPAHVYVTGQLDTFRIPDNDEIAERAELRLDFWGYGDAAARDAVEEAVSTVHDAMLRWRILDESGTSTTFGRELSEWVEGQDVREHRARVIYNGVYLSARSAQAMRGA